MRELLRGKTALVIGGTGTIGQRLVKLLFEYGPEAIRIYSRDEYKQFIMQNELRRDDSLRFLIGDVRDYDRLARACKGVDIVFHMAAMKHVPACEYNPFEAVKTNVMGTQNVIEAAIANNIERVVFTSSDKAINPSNAMGATKLLAERLISSADYYKGPVRTVFSAVRFGNVMGSRGSVIPLFETQIKKQRRITITNGDMSRFMMTVTQAALLTIEAAANAKGGEVFVLKMPVLKLCDLAEVIVEEVCVNNGIDPLAVTMEQIGLRPGEKMYEELMTSEEAENAYELDSMYAIMPMYRDKDYHSVYRGYKKARAETYSSKDCFPLTKEDIRKLIREEGLV